MYSKYINLNLSISVSFIIYFQYHVHREVSCRPASHSACYVRQISTNQRRDKRVAYPARIVTIPKEVQQDVYKVQPKNPLISSWSYIQMRNNKNSDKPYQYSEDTLRLTGFASMHFELKLGKVNESKYNIRWQLETDTCFGNPICKMVGKYD